MVSSLGCGTHNIWKKRINLGVSQALPPEGGAAPQIVTKFSMFFQ